MVNLFKAAEHVDIA